jgi:hypothetical protein
VLFSVHHEAVDFCMKRASHLAGSPGKLDYHAAWARIDLRESLRSEPLRDDLNVGIGSAKLLAELLWGQPRVIVGRKFALLVLEQLLQRLLLLRAAVQEQQYAAHGHGVADRTAIVFGAGERVCVAAQRDGLLGINGLRDASGDIYGLRAGSIAAERDKESEEQR